MRRASGREQELESEIVRLRNAMTKLEKPGVSRSDIESLLRSSADYKTLEGKYASLKERLGGFSSIMKTHIDKLKGSGIKFEFESEINTLIRSEGVGSSVVNGVVNIIDYQDRVVEVPVSDSRTKHLIHMMAVQMKKFFSKYPKLYSECDSRLTEFFQQELIDIIEVD